MLVNHLANRHPHIKPDTVPELNLPILKTQKDFFCQYCDKVSFTPTPFNVVDDLKVLQLRCPGVYFFKKMYYFDNNLT